MHVRAPNQVLVTTDFCSTHKHLSGSAAGMIIVPPQLSAAQETEEEVLEYGQDLSHSLSLSFSISHFLSFFLSL